MRAARTRGRNRAFTLVEILIVVVILGILAAIVVPQFTNAADEARNGNVVTQQRTLENQLELYRARNNGSYPAQESMWQTLRDENYIKDFPRNPLFTGEDQTSIGAFDSNNAWWWDETTGELGYFGMPEDEEEEEEEEE